MYAISELVTLMYRKASEQFRHWREHRKHKFDCLYCAHYETALRRQPTYQCPKCKTTYKSED